VRVRVAEPVSPPRETRSAARVSCARVQALIAGTFANSVNSSGMKEISRSRARAARPIETVGVTVKVPPGTIAALDRWTAHLPEEQCPPSRGDAVRKLLDETLEEKGVGTQSS
jgi:hypothetical protein